MGVDGQLGPAKKRKAEAVFGEPVLFAVATNHPWVVGVTEDDRHLWWNRQTGEHEEEDPTEVTHFWSCPLKDDGEGERHMAWMDRQMA